MTNDRNPWHKRYHVDALHGYRGLNLEQRGAYTTILDLLYDASETGLPDNERMFAAHMDCSIRKWRILRAELIALGKIYVTSTGRISNFRAEKERENAAKIQRKRIENGSAGGRAKAEQKELFNENNEPALANATANALAEGGLRARVPDSDSESEEERIYNSKPEIPAPLAREEPRLSDLIIAELHSLAGIANPVASIVSADSDLVSKWLAEGIDLDEAIRPAIIDMTATARTPSRSLKRFDAHVRMFHAKAKTGTLPKRKRKAQPPPPITESDDDDPRIADLRQSLRRQLGQRTYETWMQPDSVAIRLNGSGVIVKARSGFIADWLNEHLLPIIQPLAQQHGLGSAKIENLKA